MKAATSLKALAESKTGGFQKATYFKVRPDVVAFEQGFNLREEGEDLTEHINRLYLAMKAGAYIPPIDVAVVDGRVLVRDGPKERGQTLPPAADKTFEAKCVEFVRAVADRSTLVTYQTRDMVELIEAAYDIVEPEGGAK